MLYTHMCVCVAMLLCTVLARCNVAATLLKTPTARIVRCMSVVVATITTKAPQLTMQYKADCSNSSSSYPRLQGCGGMVSAFRSTSCTRFEHHRKKCGKHMRNPMPSRIHIKCEQYVTGTVSYKSGSDNNKAHRRTVASVSARIKPLAAA